MPKPALLTDIDEARRILGMYDAVADKEEYMKIFGITQKKLDECRELVSNRKITKPKFIE